MLTNISIMWPAVYYGCRCDNESSPSYLVAVSAWVSGKLNDTAFSNAYMDFFPLIPKLLYGTASIQDAADKMIETVNSITKYDYSDLERLFVMEDAKPEIKVKKIVLTPPQ